MAPDRSGDGPGRPAGWPRSRPATGGGRRFTREVAAARRVARFCTAAVLDASLDGDLAYLVTEYVEGPDLASAVRERGPLAGGNLEALAAGVAVALNAIHGAGWCTATSSRRT